MDYILHLLIIIALYIPFALSLDLIVGHSGVLSVAHAAFYGIGAYATAILTKGYGYAFFPSMLVGACISMAVVMVVTYALKNVKGEYYALASIGLSVIMSSLMMNLVAVTGGPFGIFGIARPVIAGVSLSSNGTFLAFTFVTAGISALLMHAMTVSHFGRVLHAIREDEGALAPLSYDVGAYKMTVAAGSAFFASISGSLYASYVSFIDPSSFTLNESIFVLTIIILGGLASVRGVIGGAVVLILLPEALRFVGLPNEIAAQARLILYGAALVYFMYKKPAGFFGNYSL